MALTDEQKAKSKNYLGYTNVGTSILDVAYDNLSETDEASIISLLSTLDSIKAALTDFSLAGITNLGGTDPDISQKQKTEDLMELGTLHVNQLSTVLGVCVVKKYFGFSQNQGSLLTWI